MYTDHGRHDAAEHLLIKTLERRRRLLGDKDPLTETSFAELCLLYEMSGQYDKLEALFLKFWGRQPTELDEDDAVLADRLNWRARFQATYIAAELRNGPEAIKNATKACELTDWSPTICHHTYLCRD